MFKNKSFNLISCILLAIILPFSCSLFKVNAESSIDEHALILTSSYEAVIRFENGDGNFDLEIAEDLSTECEAGLISAEVIKNSVSQDEYNASYRNMHQEVLKIYKNALIFRIENGYDPTIYAKTEGGIIAVRNKVKEETEVISLSSTVSEISGAYQRWVEFIASPNLAKNVLSISTSADSEIQAVAVSNTEIFASDDVLQVKPFVDSVILKNTQIALMDKVGLLTDNMGVASAISVKWLQNGVVVSGNRIPKQAVEIYIKKATLGVDLGANFQVVRYLGNQQVEFVNAHFSGDYIVISLNQFGGDIESQYSLDFFILADGFALQSQSAVEKFFSENYVVILAGVALIILISLGSSIAKSAKKKKLRKEMREFRKYKKELKRKKR